MERAIERDVQRILFSEEEIGERVETLAHEILERFAGEEITLVCVLKGSVVFAADLIRRLPIRLRLGFVTARSYGGGTEAGELHVSMPDDESFTGRTVLVTDTILDTGRTLRRVVDLLTARGAKAVVTCVLVDKRARRDVDIEADHRGFVIEDEFVVGYGLDYADEYRNLPFIGVLREDRMNGRS